jgi:hypothetical protein
MHTHLNSIKKAVNEHSEALSDYDQRSAAMHLMLGKALDGMKDKVGHSTILKGHLGNLTRCANALARAHKSMHEAVTAVHEQMHKSVDAMATQAGVKLIGTNANDFAARQDSTSHGPAADTSSAGTVEQGFKASGMNATQLQRLDKSLGAPSLFSKVQGMVNERPNQRLGKCDVGGWKALPERGQQERVLSTFEQRKLDGKQ